MLSLRGGESMDKKCMNFENMYLSKRSKACFFQPFIYWAEVTLAFGEKLTTQEFSSSFTMSVPVMPRIKLSSCVSRNASIHSAHLPIRRRQVCRLEKNGQFTAYFGCKRHGKYKTRTLDLSGRLPTDPDPFPLTTTTQAPMPPRLWSSNTRRRRR